MKFTLNLRQDLNFFRMD